MQTIRVAAAQLNTFVGDIAGNAQKIRDAIAQARELGVDIVAFPELSVTGYPPEDLLLSESFVQANLDALHAIAPDTSGIVAAVGFVDRDDDATADQPPAIYNAAGILADGKIIDVYRKHHLPNYGVFDELRYFTPGDRCLVVDVAGVKVGFCICEDVWVTPGPPDVQCNAGAQLIVCLNASPFEVGKLGNRIGLLKRIAAEHEASGVFVNQVGGQDELVFDGASFFVAPDGELRAFAPQWEQAVVAYDVPIADPASAASGNASTADRARALALRSLPPAARVSARVEPRPSVPFKPDLPPLTTALLDPLEDVYRALVVGTRDYVRKNGFANVAIAVSGGIDSALVATIAVDALGPDAVVGVNMPSRYSSHGSVADSAQLASNLGIRLWDVPIEPAHVAFTQMLSDIFANTAPNTAEENVQARIRGNVIMSIANKFGWLVLTTGNKSEMAVGYATLYGDMAGGFAVIKDIPKTLVYQLAEHRNANAPAPGEPPIPRAIIDKPPSAELKPDQTDQDSLPDYDTLDAILAAYIEQRRSPQQILAQLRREPAHASIAADTLAETVSRVVAMVDRNEYKRRQAPPGVKIAGLAFGRDRRMPIASAWRQTVDDDGSAGTH